MYTHQPPATNLDHIYTHIFLRSFKFQVSTRVLDSTPIAAFHPNLNDISISAFSDTSYIHISPDNVLRLQRISRQPWIRLIGYITSTPRAPLSLATISYMMTESRCVTVPSKDCHGLSQPQIAVLQLASSVQCGCGRDNDSKGVDILERNDCFRTQPVHLPRYSNPLCGPRSSNTGRNHTGFYRQPPLPRYLPTQPTALASSLSTKISTHPDPMVRPFTS